MARKQRKGRRSAQPGIPRASSSPTSPNQPREVVIPRTMNDEASAFSREGIESIIIAILLALLFRAFEAEAFVIPTGSMAPTLNGRHKDIKCPQCGQHWRAGASLDAEVGLGPVSSVTCPLCRFPRAIDPSRANDSSFSGDRILVNKFAYQFAEPERWDVIVFKFPGNAKQNYIKRLVGLPNETLRVRGGDVFTRGEQDEEFTITRKPPKIQLAMLQPIHDSERIPPALIEADWPHSWHAPDGAWQTTPDRVAHSTTAGEEAAWLNFRHIPLSNADWNYVSRGNLPPGIRQRTGQLVTDFYAYNAYRQRFRPDLVLNYGVRQREEQELAQREQPRQFGRHWVGDLAVECMAQVEDGGGDLMLKLVEGGHHFDCHFDLTSGQAKLMIDDGAMPFLPNADGETPGELVAQTKVQGTGSYRLRLANVDDQLRLWVNEKLVKFTAAGEDHPATYAHFDPRPAYSEQEPGDLYPARIGSRNSTVTVSKLRVLRDIYYVAVNRTGDDTDYVNSVSPQRIAQVFSSPKTWKDSELFAFADADTIPPRGRDTIEFTLHADQFFPMGDNSPQSRDARLWANGQPSLYQAGLIEPASCIERDLLIGKAFLVYWPHGWYLGNIKTPFPFIPNVGAMGRIR